MRSFMESGKEPTMRPIRRPFSARVFVAAGALGLAFLGGVREVPRAAHADNRPGCSKDLKHRSPEETIREHLALLQTGKLDEAMCDYAEDAVVVLPNTPISGLDNIRAGLTNIGALLGPTVPTVTTLTPSGSVVLITFFAFGTPCTIPDGSDTYVVEKGHIVTQTVHDTFHSAPNAVCPLATPGS